MKYKHFIDDNDTKNYYEENIIHLPHYRYGSGNSLDKDILIIIPKMLETQKLREVGYYVSTYLDMNVNFCSLNEDGTIKDTLKGVVESMNNSMYYTFGLHIENEGFENPIKKPFENITEIKCVETVRTLLSEVSRTNYRSIVKPALTSRDMSVRLDVLSRVDFMEVSDILNHDRLKTLTFVLAQAYLNLLGKEVYTKNDIIKYLPVFEDHMNRKGILTDKLQIFNSYKNDFVAAFNNNYKVEKLNDYDNKFTQTFIWFNGEKKLGDSITVCLHTERIKK